MLAINYTNDNCQGVKYSVSHPKWLHNWRVLLLKWENDLQYVYIKFIEVAKHFFT